MFPDDPCVPLHNNASERALRGPVFGRVKLWLSLDARHRKPLRGSAHANTDTCRALTISRATAAKRRRHANFKLVSQFLRSGLAYNKQATS